MYQSEAWGEKITLNESTLEDAHAELCSASNFKRHYEIPSPTEVSH